MYTIFIVLLLAAATLLIFWGVKQRAWGQLLAGAALLAVTWGFFWFLGFWGEVLWFEAIGYSRRFWTFFLATVLSTAAGGALGLFILWPLTAFLPRERRRTRGGARALGAGLGLAWGFVQWEVILKFFYQASTEIAEPVLGRVTSFYLFTLPFLDALYRLLFILTVVAVASALISAFFRVAEQDAIERDRLRFDRALATGVSSLMFVLAYGFFLDRYHLLHSTWGGGDRGLLDRRACAPPSLCSDGGSERARGACDPGPRVPGSAEPMAE